MKNSVFIILGIFIIAVVANAEPTKEIVTPFITTFANIAAAGGLIALFFQFKRERDLNEADFILRINNDFMTNESITRIYKILEESKIEGQKHNPFKKDDLIAMANYLTYFEPFYSLIKRKVVKIDSIDPILAYRFFLATNNKFMQQMVLCAEGKEIAWESTYKLHRYWMNYRNKLNRDTWQNNHSLQKNKSYTRVVMD